jgi:NAD(P)-dependent dehydrogenase (short-subunit alcohol dehydrogenase family)
MTGSHTFDLSDATVLVTGAAGDIGNAIARAFLQRGACVHLSDLDQAELATRSASLGEPERVTSTAGDLADPAAIARIAAGALSVSGAVDILVNNAAIQAEGDLESCSPELFDRAYAVNVRAPYLLARALVPAMRAKGGGAIVNVASVHATAPGPKRLAYATSKTALLGLTRSLAVDLGCDNIRVNAISPGATLTRQLLEGWGRLGGAIDVMAHATRQHPLRRIAAVDEIADAVVFLATNTILTGIELRADAGLLSSLRLLPLSNEAETSA